MKSCLLIVLFLLCNCFKKSDGWGQFFRDSHFNSYDMYSTCENPETNWEVEVEKCDYILGSNELMLKNNRLTFVCLSHYKEGTTNRQNRLVSLNSCSGKVLTNFNFTYSSPEYIVRGGISPPDPNLDYYIFLLLKPGFWFHGILGVYDLSNNQLLSWNYTLEGVYDMVRIVSYLPKSSKFVKPQIIFYDGRRDQLTDIVSIDLFSEPRSYTWYNNNGFKCPNDPGAVFCVLTVDEDINSIWTMTYSHPDRSNNEKNNNLNQHYICQINATNGQYQIYDIISPDSFNWPTAVRVSSTSIFFSSDRSSHEYSVFSYDKFTMKQNWEVKVVTNEINCLERQMIISPNETLMIYSYFFNGKNPPKEGGVLFINLADGKIIANFSSPFDPVYVNYLRKVDGDDMVVITTLDWNFKATQMSNVYFNVYDTQGNFIYQWAETRSFIHASPVVDGDGSFFYCLKRYGDEKFVCVAKSLSWSNNF